MKKSILATAMLLLFTPFTQAECIVEGTVQQVRTDTKTQVEVLFDRVSDKANCKKIIARESRKQGILFQEEKVMLAMVPEGTRVKYAYADNSWELKQVTFN